MNEKTRATRGHRRASQNVVLAIDTQGYAADRDALQVSTLSQRYGLSPAVAAATAALAFTIPESWRAGR